MMAYSKTNHEWQCASDLHSHYVSAGSQAGGEQKVIGAPLNDGRVNEIRCNSQYVYDVTLCVFYE